MAKTRKKNPWIQGRQDPVRIKKTAKERGEVSPEVYKEAANRAGWKCERCGWDPRRGWGDPVRDRVEAAHVERRWKAGQEGIQATDILILCGPQVNSGTCHNWADNTAAGREWMLQKREENRGMMAWQDGGRS